MFLSGKKKQVTVQKVQDAPICLKWKTRTYRCVIYTYE